MAVKPLPCKRDASLECEWPNCKCYHDALTRKEAEMGRLTREEIEHFRIGERDRKDISPGFIDSLCDLALRALSLESVREEALAQGDKLLQAKRSGYDEGYWMGLEEAAKVCDDASDLHANGERWMDAAEYCASEIRALRASAPEQVGTESSTPCTDPRGHLTKGAGKRCYFCGIIPAPPSPVPTPKEPRSDEAYILRLLRRIADLERALAQREISGPVAEMMKRIGEAEGCVWNAMDERAAIPIVDALRQAASLLAQREWVEVEPTH